MEAQPRVQFVWGGLGTHQRDCYQIRLDDGVPFRYEDEGSGLAARTLFGNLGFTEDQRLAAIRPVNRFSALALKVRSQRENLSSLLSLFVLFILFPL